MFEFEVVGKIGSMALIRKEDQDIDYNTIARVSSELKPGMIWVTSGATEIGRIDYIKRTGKELTGSMEDIKADYAAQGQSILMEQYRQFVRPDYSIRQLLVEHQHFNDVEKRDHIKRLLLRAAQQHAIPIINYNDPVSGEENRKMELMSLRKTHDDVVECVDNDETAAVIAGLVKSKFLVILTSTEGIYKDVKDPATLVREVSGSSIDDVVRNVRELQKSCIGTSRAGSNGAYAKLEFTIKPATHGTTVIIGHAKYKISDLINGKVPHTRVGMA